MLCRIRGRVSPPGAEVVFHMEQGGVSDGVLYAPQRIAGRVSADGGIEARDGSSLAVPPSADVGVYIVAVGDRMWQNVAVPREQSADLVQLLGAAGG